MAKTVNTSANGYALYADLINYRDARQIADFTKDDGNRDGSASTSTVVTAVLKRASGDVESACILGNRYLPVDLAALSGSSQQTLVGLVCDIAFWHLVKRRNPRTSIDEVSGIREAFELLQRLREGERIFSFQETMDAEQMDAIDIGKSSDGVDRTMTKVADRFFGQRAKTFVGPP